MTFSYGTDLVAVQAPGPERPRWSAWARKAGTTDTHQTSKGVLDFKPRKEGEYVQRCGQGKCNLALQSELDPTFALDASYERPEGVEARTPPYTPLHPLTPCAPPSRRWASTP